jgi:hypothetical protein
MKKVKFAFDKSRPRPVPWRPWLLGSVLALCGGAGLTQAAPGDATATATGKPAAVVPDQPLPPPKPIPSKSAQKAALEKAAAQVRGEEPAQLPARVTGPSGTPSSKSSAGGKQP